jgi:activating signal cointegrator complex subunit 2
VVSVSYLLNTINTAIFRVMASKMTALPPPAPFPAAAWRSQIVPEEWEACLDAWVSLTEAHLSLSSLDFLRISAKDESLAIFLKSFAAELALTNEMSSGSKAKELRKSAFFLSYRLLDLDKPPELLLRYGFLSDMSKIYGKGQGSKLLSMAWKKHFTALEASIGSVKNSLIKLLDAGLKGDLKAAEQQLKRLNYLLHASPETSTFFMAGTDFLDSLISCYSLMNPPLRKAIISTTYLSLIGLTEGEKPIFSSLVDQLYSLKAAAETHKAGPTNVNDSLVAELVTVTPLLKQIQQRIEASGSGSSRAKAVITTLEGFRKSGGSGRSGRPVRLIKRTVDKEKGNGILDGFETRSRDNVHIHQMSLISQIQDLFPDLGSGFIVKLLDQYSEDVEQVISHLLEGSLPAQLQGADRGEQL